MQPKLISALETFYNSGPNQGDCQELINIHFNGNIENNIILAGMIFLFRKSKTYSGPKNLGLDDCIFNSKDNYKNNLNRRPAIKPNDFLRSLVKDGISYTFFISRQFLSVHKKMQAKYEDKDYIIGKISLLHDFKYFLSILKRIDMLNQETIKDLFKFEKSNWEWNGEQFNAFKKEFNERYPNNPLNKEGH